MTPTLQLAIQSAWSRRMALGLALVTIAISVMLLLAFERLREEVRTSFAQSVSGVDLIVGARASPIQLVLHAVFHLGTVSQNMSIESVKRLEQHPAVAWVVPIALGDSHRGYPVLGTSADYFNRFRYGDARPLVFAHGKPFVELFDTVIGAEVAKRLGYQLGARILLETLRASHKECVVAVTEICDRVLRAG